MDTTPPSKAVILHSSLAADHVSNSLLSQAVWGPINVYNHTGATSQSTPALLNGPHPNGCVFMRNPSTSTTAIGLTSLAGHPASGSTSQLGFAGSTSPVHHGKPNGTVLAYEKRPCASYIAVPTSEFTLNTGMGSGDCNSSSTNFTPSTSALGPPLKGTFVCGESDLVAVTFAVSCCFPSRQMPLEKKQSGDFPGLINPLPKILWHSFVPKQESRHFHEAFPDISTLCPSVPC
ncbi:hypothetical protein A6R68_05401, partial [Neotoma lepida]